MLLRIDYRLATFAATAVLAEVRGHEAGHCEGSDTGQAFALDVKAAFAFAGAAAVTAPADLQGPVGQFGPQSEASTTQLPEACAAATAT